MLAIVAIQPANAEWKGGVEGGTVISGSGNGTRVRLVLSNDARPFTQYLYAEWLRTGAERNAYALGYNPRYWLSDTYYTFAESEFRVDDTFGIDQEIKLLGGLGGQFLTTEVQGLNLEFGVGGRTIEFAGRDDAFNEALGVGRLNYYRSFADTIKFDINLSSSLSSEEVSEASSEVGLSLRIPAGVMRVAYRSRYQKIGDGESITDEDTALSFGYSF